MKFNEMNDKQQDAFKNLLITALSIRAQEEQKYTNEYYRLLMIGNGAGIGLLATFMGAVVRNNGQIANLKTPLVSFFVGAVLAALVYYPLAAVSSQATPYVTNEAVEFFLNKKGFDEITGYTFTRVGRLVVNTLLLGSLTAFGIGVYKIIIVLGQLP